MAFRPQGTWRPIELPEHIHDRPANAVIGERIKFHAAGRVEAIDRLDGDLLVRDAVFDDLEPQIGLEEAGELAAELTAAGQKLLGADSAAALLNGQELTIGPITIPPFTVRLGKASAS